MISAESVQAHIESAQTTLRRTVEGRAILETCASDALIASGGRSSSFEEISILGRNLVEFITGQSLAASKRPDFFAALENHPEGRKAIAGMEKKFGFEAQLDLIEKMAAHVVQHGKAIAASSPEALAQREAEYQKAKASMEAAYLPEHRRDPATQPPAAVSEFPDAELDMARSEDSRKGRKKLAALEMSEPAENDPQPKQLAYYNHLQATERWTEATVFYSRRKHRILT